jgi:hypothetical protein
MITFIICFSLSRPTIFIGSTCQIGKATTFEEKEAFLWFIGEFLASVVGTKVWGRKKYYNRVLEAVIDKGNQDLVVTVSDQKLH